MELCHYCFGFPLINEGYADCPYCDGTGCVDYDDYDDYEDMGDCEIENEWKSKKDENDEWIDVCPECEAIK